MSCPIDIRILRGYFPLIDFSVVGRLNPENHRVRGDGTSNVQIASNRGVSQFGLPIGHVQTVSHIHRCIEIRGSVYRHRVRRILAEDDIALEVGYASHSERTIHIRLFERGIARDTQAAACDSSSSCVHSIAGYFAGYCQTATCNGSRSCSYSIAGYFAGRS